MKDSRVAVISVNYLLALRHINHHPNKSTEHKVIKDFLNNILSKYPDVIFMINNSKVSDSPINFGRGYFDLKLYQLFCVNHGMTLVNNLSSHDTPENLVTKFDDLSKNYPNNQLDFYCLENNQDKLHSLVIQMRNSITTCEKNYTVSTIYIDGMQIIHQLHLSCLQIVMNNLIKKLRHLISSTNSSARKLLSLVGKISPGINSLSNNQQSIEQLTKLHDLIDVYKVYTNIFLTPEDLDKHVEFLNVIQALHENLSTPEKNLLKDLGINISLMFDQLFSEFNDLRIKYFRDQAMKCGYQNFVNESNQNTFLTADEIRTAASLRKSRPLSKKVRKIDRGKWLNYSMLLNKDHCLLLGHPLDSGSHGRVKTAYEVETQQFKAVKIIKIDDEHPLAHLNEELEFLNLYNPGNLSYLLERNDKAYIVMPPAIANLKTYVQNNLGNYNLENILSLALQITEEVLKLHRKGILHLDLKLENILVNKDGIKISDFGLSVFCLHNKAVVFQRFEGQSKHPHLPKELYRLTHRDSRTTIIDASADVYSLGYAIRKLFKLTDVEIPDLIGCLVQKMMHDKPGDRPTIEDVAEKLKPSKPKKNILKL